MNWFVPIHLLTTYRCLSTDCIKAQEFDHVRAYTLSKEAIIVWTMAQTQKLIGLNLRMKSVSLAAVSTGILDGFSAAFGEKMTKNVTRVGRPGTADEIADLILFLCSDNSRWVKGQDIVIDGGMSALIQLDARTVHEYKGVEQRRLY